jgi:hypothetical protein
MKEATKTALAVAGGTILSAWYFADSERGIPRESNCTYLAPWTTDVAAWAAGATLIYLGHRNKSPTTTFIGSAVATLHIAQFAAHKIKTREPREALLAAMRTDMSDEMAVMEDVGRPLRVSAEILG